MSEIEGLTAEQVAALRRAGVHLAPAPKGEGRAEAQARLQLARMRAGALNASQVAELLGAPVEAVAEMTAERRLYAFGDDTDPLYPPWQFRRGEVVTGLGAVIALIPDGWPPVGVERFLTEPTPSLDGMSPLDWLDTGRPARWVMTIAERLRARS